MYVSPVLAQSLLDVYPGFAESAAEARESLREQFSNKEDISNDELLRTIEICLNCNQQLPEKYPVRCSCLTSYNSLLVRTHSVPTRCRRLLSMFLEVWKSPALHRYRTGSNSSDTSITKTARSIYREDNARRHRC